MCQAGQTRPIDRDNARDGGPWLVLTLVTVRAPEGVLFGRLEARVGYTSPNPDKGKYWK